MKRKYRSQTRILGVTKIPAYTALLEEIEECIREDMKMFRVSRSFVIATHLAHSYGVKAEDYRKPRILKRA